MIIDHDYIRKLCKVVQDFVMAPVGQTFPDGSYSRNATEYDLVSKAFDTAFIPYAWPGGYPIIFSTRDEGDVLCAKCAKGLFILEHKDINCAAYYEGPTLQCTACQTDIESAYGDPDVE